MPNHTMQKASISESKAPDLIFVGGGPVDTPQLTRWRGQSRFVAVDGGLNWLMEAGIQPETVLGDMDSADPGHVATCRAAGIPIKDIADQNSTDLEKALMHYPDGAIIGFGFLDGRLDHTLAALHALMRVDGAERVLLIGAHDALMISKRQASFALPESARLSVWPLGQIRFHDSQGLVWPLDGLEMEIGVQTGTSNRAIGGEITISPDTASTGAYALLVEASDWQALYAIVSSSKSA